MLIALVLGALVGLTLGLTGAGGGILAVPALTLGLGLPMQVAAPMALIAVAGSAALGAGEGLMRGLVRYRAATLMSLAALPMTSVGVVLAQLAPQRWLLLGFGALMLSVARRNAGDARRAAVAAPVPDPGSAAVPQAAAPVPRPLAHLDPATGKLRWSGAVAVVIGGIGALTGLLTGLLGVGGGFVIVPALSRFTNIPPQGIVATSLMVIALVGSAGVVAALAHGAQLPAYTTAMFTAATAAGLIGGRLLIHRFSNPAIKGAFAAVLSLVAALLIGKALFFM
jgi:uncharacterized membrane protein YfcA